MTGSVVEDSICSEGIFGLDQSEEKLHYVIGWDKYS